MHQVKVDFKADLSIRRDTKKEAALQKLLQSQVQRHPQLVINQQHHQEGQLYPQVIQQKFLTQKNSSTKLIENFGE